VNPVIVIAIYEFTYISATIVGTVFVILANVTDTIASKLGVNNAVIDKLLTLLPLQEQGLGWVAPAVIMAVIGLLLKQKTEYQNEA